MSEATPPNHGDKRRDEILERIRKLMARGAADSGSSENEIEMALKFARKLMSDHNVAEEEVWQRAASDADSVNIEDGVAMKRHSFDAWERDLAGVMEQVCDVKGYLDMRNGQAIHFVGTARDVAIASALYADVLVIIRTMAKARQGAGWTGLHRSYCLGFIKGLLDKVRADKQAAAGAAGAIILLKSQIITRYFEKNLPDLRPAWNPSAPVDSAAFNAGRADGRETSLATGVLKGK